MESDSACPFPAFLSEGQQPTRAPSAFMINDLLASGLDANDLVLIYGFEPTDNGYRIPYLDSSGNPLVDYQTGEPFYRIRLEHPGRGRDGKVMKYYSPAGSGINIFVPPTARLYLTKDPHGPMFLTEGEKKAIKASQEGLPTIAIPGIWMWKDRAGSPLLNPSIAEFLQVPRDIFLIFDSDATDEKKRRSFDLAAEGLADAVAQYGCKLYRIDLPDIGGKTGLDDWFVRGQTIKQLHAYIERKKHAVMRDTFAVEVATAKQKERIRRQAKREINEEEAAEKWDARSLPPIRTLAEILEDDPDLTLDWFVQDLAAQNFRILLAAQQKAGKSTLMLNLIRSVLTGAPFLGHHYCAVAAPDEVVFYLDTELGEKTVKAWAGQMLTRQDAGRLIIWSLRGKCGTVDIRAEAIRKQMAAQIREATTGRRIVLFVVDVLSAWTAALGIKENANDEIREFLEAVDSLRKEVDAGVIAATHHAGHQEDGRTRGASAWLDWPDSIWILTRKGDTESNSGDRFFKAYGRDVDFHKTRMDYDPSTRLLSLSAATATKETERQKMTALLFKVVEIVRDVAPRAKWTVKALKKELGGNSSDACRAISMAEYFGFIKNRNNSGEKGGFIQGADYCFVQNPDPEWTVPS